MMTPYARIIPVHLTIILGAFIGIIVGLFSKAADSILLLVLFTALKVGVEVFVRALFDSMKKDPKTAPEKEA